MDVIHRYSVATLRAIGDEPFSLPIFPDARIVHFGYKPPRATVLDGGAGDVRTESPSLFMVWERHSVDLVRPAVVPERWFRVAATGEPFHGIHHGTTVFPNGSVWHLIEESS